MGNKDKLMALNLHLFAMPNDNCNVLMQKKLMLLMKIIFHLHDFRLNH